MAMAAKKYGMAEYSVACSVLTWEFPPLLVLFASAVPASIFLMMIAIQELRLQTHSTAAQYSAVSTDVGQILCKASLDCWCTRWSTDMWLAACQSTTRFDKFGFWQQSNNINHWQK
eukprot:GHUV01028744.1.p2 GENE.GHUV01028744.1~~GHUV01028744.1.p2  ORF type:complete len:116 (-),score=16.55 GHUV01028744.1:218-565(-)